MWMVLSVCFVTFMVIVGITEIICRFWLYLMKPKDSPLAVMVIYLKEDIATEQLRYALEFLSWERKGTFSALAVGTENLSEKTFKEVEKIINSRNDVILIKDLQ
jgi:hypothetical protein